MAIVKQAVKENDVVELLDAVDRRPSGTIGTVVSERGEMKLVEISDECGVALDYLSVTAQRLKLVT